jgi:hypothetical protein
LSDQFSHPKIGIERIDQPMPISDEGAAAVATNEPAFASQQDKRLA